MSAILLSDALSSLDRVIFIEKASAMYFGDDFGRLEFVAHFSKYYVRTVLKSPLKLVLGAGVMAPIINGFIGGAIGYGLRAKNIAAGMVNNAGYELCSDNEACDKSPKNNFLVTFALELLDPVLKVTFGGIYKYVSAKIYEDGFVEAAINLVPDLSLAIYEDEFVETAINLVQDLSFTSVISAVEGALISALIIEFIFAPNIDFTANLANCAYNSDAFCAVEVLSQAVINTAMHPLELIPINYVLGDEF